MSDSSEDEDMSRFREAVDNSILRLMNQPQVKTPVNGSKIGSETPKSERYLEESSHYNDIKVPDVLQKKIGAKISEIIERNVVFVDIEDTNVKKRKIKGGVKLFKDSTDFLSWEEAKDTYTESHNFNSKKIERKRRHVEEDVNDLDENEKIKAATVSGDYVLSKEETKWWKPRRKEKVFRYKKQGKSKVLTAIE